MKKIYFARNKLVYMVANWKANKTVAEAREWMEKVFRDQESGIRKNLEVIVCAPFVTLPALKEQLLNSKPSTLVPKLGAQDLSPFADGPYTGEVTGRMLKDLAEYVIIGHSERRQYFGETEEIVSKKVEMAFKNNLMPIVCVSELNQGEKLKQFTIYNPPAGGQFTILYEPLFAIGSGQPDTPENANLMAEKIHQLLPNVPVLYGGSVNPENVKSFLVQPQISGVGVGKESLNPQTFLEIIANAPQV